jgi:hypothetical protein
MGLALAATVARAREGVAVFAFVREVAPRRVGAGGRSGGFAVCMRVRARVWCATGGLRGRA